MNRRNFIQTATGGALAQAALKAQIQKSQLGTGIKLGFDTYSVRAFKW